MQSWSGKSSPRTALATRGIFWSADSNWIHLVPNANSIATGQWQHPNAAGRHHVCLRSFSQTDRQTAAGMISVLCTAFPMRG